MILITKMLRYVFVALHSFILSVMRPFTRKERYDKAINGVEDLRPGGFNPQAVTGDMNDQLPRLKESLSTEDRYACGHRRLQIYLIDESLRT